MNTQGEKESNIMGVMNSAGLWVACSFIVIVTLVQSLVIMKRAVSTAGEMGFSGSQIVTAIRAGAISSFGPSCAVGIGVVALMAIIGGPAAWMRLSVVGSLGFELMNVNTAITAIGGTLGSLTDMQMTTGLWALCLSVVPYMINVIFFAPSYEKLLHKVSGGDPRVFNIIMTATFVGLFGRTTVGFFMYFNIGQVWAFSGAFVTAGIMVLLGIKKLKKQWLNEWTLPVGMVAGMVLVAFMLK